MEILKEGDNIEKGIQDKITQYQNEIHNLKNSKPDPE